MSTQKTPRLILQKAILNIIIIFGLVFFIKKYLYMYLKNVKFRVKIPLNITLFFNGFYSAFQLVLGIKNNSVWNISFSAYYSLLALMRFYLLRYTKEHSLCENIKRELQIFRFCGVAMLILNVILSVIVFYITWQNKGFSHTIFTTAVISVYTTVSVVKSIYNLIRYKKYKSPAINAVKTIGVTSSAVSLLTLETTLFQTETPIRRIITGITGFLVITFILVYAIYIIVFSNKKLHSIK